MAENNKRRKVRSESMALDAMHIIIGIAVVVMAVISFLDTERYMFLFPAIFFLADLSFSQDQPCCLVLFQDFRCAATLPYPIVSLSEKSSWIFPTISSGV